MYGSMLDEIYNKVNELCPKLINHFSSYCAGQFNKLPNDKKNSNKKDYICT